MRDESAFTVLSQLLEVADRVERSEEAAGRGQGDVRTSALELVDSLTSLGWTAALPPAEMARWTLGTAWHESRMRRSRP